MTGRCAECRHWSDAEDYTYAPGKRVCSQAHTREPFGDDEDGSRLMMAMGGDLSSDLCTAPTFGCVLFEAKEEG